MESSWVDPCHCEEGLPQQPDEATPAPYRHWECLVIYKIEKELGLPRPRLRTGARNDTNP